MQNLELKKQINRNNFQLICRRWVLDEKENSCISGYFVVWTKKMVIYAIILVAKKYHKRASLSSMNDECHFD